VTYKQIAEYFNERNITTARGCEFSDSGVEIINGTKFKYCFLIY
jgi:hypothetical protein